MVGLSGLEPEASSLSEMRSNQLSYRPIYQNFNRGQNSNLIYFCQDRLSDTFLRNIDNSIVILRMI